MVGNAQPHTGVAQVKLPQLIQQKHIQSGLAGADGQRAAFQRGNTRQLAFPRLQLLLGDFHVGKQHLALRRHRHAAGAAHQQLAAQLFLQPVQGAGHIGLAHAQHIGRAGNAVIFADIVKQTVIFIIYIHNFSSFRCVSPYQILIFCMQNIYFTNAFSDSIIRTVPENKAYRQDQHRLLPQVIASGPAGYCPGSMAPCSIRI